MYLSEPVMALIPGLTTPEGDGARDTPVRPGTIHLKGASDQGILVFLSGLNNLSFSLPFVSCFNNKSFLWQGRGSGELIYVRSQISNRISNFGRFI